MSKTTLKHTCTFFLQLFLAVIAEIIASILLAGFNPEPSNVPVETEFEADKIYLAHKEPKDNLTL